MEGGRVPLTKELEKEMHQAAAVQDFEAAARLRNKLGYLRELQHKIMFGDKEFLDISKDKALSGLVDLFGLSKIPARIEGYDISHMSGTNVVASQVVFMNGASSRADYRKYKVKIQQNDDYASMHETLSRRFSEKNIKAWGKPDLILIDGGKGQLDAALRAMEERDVIIPTVSVAKREEEIIIHATRSGINTNMLDIYRKNPAPGVSVEREGEYYILNLHAGQVNLSPHSKNLRGGTGQQTYSDIVKLFQRIRDESHRFAVSYHTVLKRAKQTSSVLEEIPGIGPATRRKLIRSFGSLRAVQSAPHDELIKVVGESRANLIKQYLQSS
jgi:excinuclease ABC subunit C